MTTPSTGSDLKVKKESMTNKLGYDNSSSIKSTSTASTFH